MAWQKKTNLSLRYQIPFQNCDKGFGGFPSPLITSLNEYKFRNNFAKEMLKKSKHGLI